MLIAAQPERMIKQQIQKWNDREQSLPQGDENAYIVNRTAQEAGMEAEDGKN